MFFDKISIIVKTISAENELKNKIKNAKSDDEKDCLLIELLNKYYETNNCKKLVTFFCEMFPLTISKNVDFNVIKKVFNILFNKKKYTLLLKYIETFENNRQTLQTEQFVFIYTIKGLVYKELRLYDKAVFSFEKIINSELPQSDILGAKLAKFYVYIDKKDYNNALDILSDTFKLYNNDDFYKCYSFLSVLFFKQNNRKIGEKSLKVRKMLENSNSLKFEDFFFIGKFNFELANILKKNMFYEVAIKYFKNAIRHSKNLPQKTICFKWLKDCFSNLGNYYKSRGYSKLIIKMTNSKILKIKHLQSLSTAYFYTKEYEKSLKISLELLKYPQLFEESFYTHVLR